MQLIIGLYIGIPTENILLTYEFSFQNVLFSPFVLLLFLCFVFDLIFTLWLH